MSTIVTIFDNNVVNRIAAKVLIYGLKNHKVPYDKFFVLYPTNTLLPEYKSWFVQQGVFYREYSLEDSDDPYYSKFLLESFISEYEVENSHLITYLDPDHVVFDNFKFSKPMAKSLYVSSEKFIGSQKILDVCHYNTSLISGSKFSWSKVLRNWKKVYQDIYDVIDFRYREEIAFSIAAYQSKITLHRVSDNFQGCYRQFGQDIKLFHYGGEDQLAKRIKSYIIDQPTRAKNLRTMLTQTRDGTLQKVLCEILLAIEKI